MKLKVYNKTPVPVPAEQIVEEGISSFEDIKNAMNSMKTLHFQLLGILDSLSEKMNLINVPDNEVCYHASFLKELKKLAKDIEERASKVKTANDLRFFMMVVPRKIDGISAFGKTYTVDASMIPGAPNKKDKPKEHLEYMEWVRKSQYRDSIEEVIHWKSLERICNELTEKGEPQPPHVKLYPKPKVKITKLK